MIRWAVRLGVLVSLAGCTAVLFGWRCSYERGSHAGDLVRWNGSDSGFLDRGFSYSLNRGRLAVTLARVTGGIAVAGRVDDSHYALPTDGDFITGLGDGRAGSGGPPNRWNWATNVWDFNIRNDELIDTGEPSVDTPWGLRVGRRRAAWDVPWADTGKVSWERITFVDFRAPFWLLAMATALLPVVYAGSWGRWGWRRWRLRPGTCRVCGYDLRVTPERCPECGSTRSAFGSLD